ncbi:MAG: nickel-dependent lactate racemase [Spirochaetia bacterium]
MRCSLSYGKSELAVELPDDWDITVIRKKPIPVCRDPFGSVERSLDAPIGSAPLHEEARGSPSACILICDITRPVPNALVLRPVIERLLGAGVDPAAITILIATGLHRPNEGTELGALIGDPWVHAHASVANHIARNDEDHRYVGTTSQGIPIRLDRRFLDAGIRLAVGLVEPHFMAGWSGGRKLIVPGIAHAETIAAFHAERMLKDPRASTCVLDGNPLHEAQREALRMIGRALAVNLVIDESRALSFVSFGGIEESHAAAVSFADPYFRLSVPRRFPTVLTSAAGFPLDATYYQTVKGICCGAAILQQGGDLFVGSECSEGFGSADFRRSQERLCRHGKDRFRAAAASRSSAYIDEWETVMLLKALDTGTVHLLSDGLTDEDHSMTGAERVVDLAGEVRAAVERDPGHRIAVIPEGPYVAPEHHAAGAGI